MHVLDNSGIVSPFRHHGLGRGEGGVSCVLWVRGTRLDYILLTEASTSDACFDIRELLC